MTDAEFEYWREMNQPMLYCSRCGDWLPEDDEHDHDQPSQWDQLDGATDDDE